MVEVSAVVVGAVPIVKPSGVEAAALAKLSSPLYVALIVCAPLERPLMVWLAVPLLPRFTGAPEEKPSTVNCTVPVGLSADAVTGATVAVTVSVWLKLMVPLGETESARVVGAEFVPVPVKFAPICEPFTALLWKERVSVCAPIAVGLKVTETPQEVPVASPAAQPSLLEAETAKSPVLPAVAS